MRKASDYLNLAYKTFDEAAHRGLMYRYAEDDRLDGRELHVGGQTLLNFGSCSYLGLETDERLKQGAIEMIMRYGTQFSSSRAYMSSPGYDEFESLLAEIFGAPTLIAPTTTLGHFSTMPVIMEENDAIILDQQAHNSLQMAVNLVRPLGVRVEMIRHNRMDMLEALIEELRKTHRRVWFVGDGVYSMFGDFVPTAALNELLSRYEQFHVYLDDAHAMSWCGPHGRGHVLERMPLNDRMIVGTSLNKAFASGGGALIIPNEQFRRRVRTVGGPMVYSGPLQPANLGAGLASARIHLSEEITQRQQALQANIQLCNRLLAEAELPVLDSCEAPIRFIGMGLPKVAFNMMERLWQDGLYVNLAVFPLVPMRRSGLRFTLTTHQSEDDIRRLVAGIAHHLPRALADEGRTIEDVRKAFELPTPDARPTTVTFAPNEALTLTHVESIAAIEPAEWDGLLGHEGSFTWEGLRFLESTFRDQPRPENNWRFHYYVVRDGHGRPVLATFFTDALWKDDMIAPQAVSRLVEDRRRHDPYFLTSQTLAMGALLTEGNHLYLDRQADWRGALSLLLEAIAQEQELSKAATLALRDLPGQDPEMDAFLNDQGFAKFLMPESLVLDLDWDTDEAWLARMSQKTRKHQRREVLAFEPAYEVEVLRQGGRQPSAEELAHFNRLYRNVKGRSLMLNTFDLPDDLYEQMLASPDWELLVLRLKDDPSGLPVSVTACYIGAAHYVPLVIGLDYEHLETQRVYRVSLLKMIRRAKALGFKRVLFGMGAELEKRRFGAKPDQRAVYTQASEHFNMELLHQFMADAGQG